jgi:hypothetical protein
MKLIEVYPLNGFGNRIQAISSGINSALELNLSIKINWIVNEQFPLSSGEIFSKKTLSKFNISDVYQNPYQNFKIGLTDKKDGRLIVKGGGKGEQFFINSCKKQKSILSYQKITLVSGGFFNLKSDKVDLQRIRSNYTKIEFSNSLLNKTKKLKLQIPAKYDVLHLRFKDRSHESAKMSDIKKYFEKNPISLPLCVIGDDRDINVEISSMLKMINPETFMLNNSIPNRYSSQGLVDALVEFLVISGAEMVHASSPSSFSEESIYFNPKPPLYSLIKGPQYKSKIRYCWHKISVKLKFMFYLPFILTNKIKILGRKVFKINFITLRKH